MLRRYADNGHPICVHETGHTDFSVFVRSEILNLLIALLIVQLNIVCNPFSPIISFTRYWTVCS